MQEKIILEDYLIAYAQEQESLGLIAKVDPSLYDYTFPTIWYLGLESQGLDLSGLELIDPEVVILSDASLQENAYQVWYLLKDMSRHILQWLDLDDLLQNEDLAQVKMIYNPQNLAFRATSSSTDKQAVLSQKQLTDWTHAYFRHIIDTAMILEHEQNLTAQISLHHARKILFQIVEAAVDIKTGGQAQYGPQAYQLSQYLSEIPLDHLNRSYPVTDKDRIWDAIFQACMLFRKAGLLIMEKTELDYPKEIDVEMMKILRALWEAGR